MLTVKSQRRKAAKKNREPEVPRRAGAPVLWIGNAFAAVIGTLLVLAGVRVFGPHAPEPRLRRYAIPVSRLIADFQHPACISPDGLFLLFSSGKRLVVRDLG